MHDGAVGRVGLVVEGDLLIDESQQSENVSGGGVGPQLLDESLDEPRPPGSVAPREITGHGRVGDEKVGVNWDLIIVRVVSVSFGTVTEPHSRIQLLTLASLK